MGAVYQARDLHFPTVPKLVAVKEMINMAQDAQLRETTMKNFEREAEILATLNHPAIPQIYDFFSFGDRAYLVMEFIQGKDLEAILNSTDGFLPVEQVRQWGIEICDVLAYLHNHEPEPIVFRDMKPSNVMVDHHRRIRLIDFGIAKTFQMGQPGTMIGTDGYAAPEQYKGLASPAADIYSLGATLHHLLTRRDPRLEPPFSFQKRPITELNTNASEELAAVVMRALNYDTENRYATAAAMKQSLEAAGPNGGSIAVAHQPAAAPVAAPAAGAPVVAAPAAVPQPAVPQPASVVPIWSFKVEDAVRSTPLIHDGTLYIGSYDNNLWALDTSDGSLKWKFATEGGIGSSPAYSAGVVYIGSTDGSLHAVDARMGTRKWFFKAESRIYTTPTIAAERLFFGTDTGEMMCMNLSGEMRWRFETRRRVMSSPVEQDGVIFFGSDDWYVYALDIEQGYPNWRFRTRGAVVSTPAVGDKYVYFGSGDGFVYAVETLGGREGWKFEVGKPVTSSPALYRDAIYVGAVDGALYCLHAQTGELLWRFQSNGPIISSPRVVDDVVYVGSDDHNIYALQA